MKAIVSYTYGSPDVLKYEQIDRPVPGDGEVLIKVHAAAVNPLDWHLQRGTPSILRLALGLTKPRDARVGRDLAGTVQAVGANVRNLKPGDEVFGACRGAFAEYACAPENQLALKPTSLSFEQAAAIPIAGLTAVQALRDTGQLKAGQKLLINGAAGGVGTFAVQIGKYFGAQVTGVCSTRNLDFIRSLGADHAIDYTHEDFTAGTEGYDVIFDLVGIPFAKSRRALTPNGIVVGGGLLGTQGRHFGPWLLGFLQSVLLARFGSKRFEMMVAKMTVDDLTFVGELVEKGKVIPVIDRRYPLSQAAEAIKYLAAEHARGKVIITV